MKQTIKVISELILLMTIIILQGCFDNSSLTVSDTKCENLSGPLGINTLKPRFSWKNISDVQGATQTAYQILIASDRCMLTEKKADVWNSGKIQSSDDVLVEYDGEILSSGQLLFWKVRTWDENDKVSNWSDPSKFGIGLLEESDWTANYIGFVVDNEDGFNSCPQFRKMFIAEKPDKKETYHLHINSLGYHEVYMNGKKVGDEVLSPAVSQFNKRSLVNTYDVTPFLQEGENNLIIWLGSGWYSKGLPGVTGDGPLVKAQLDKITGQTIERIAVTDKSWTARNSEYTRISDWSPGRYGGEQISGNVNERNKSLTNPDDVTWSRVTVVNVPDHKVTPQMVEHNKIKDTILPIKIDKLNDTTFLVDMGKTLSGWFEITFPGLLKSQVITMEYADHLNDAGEPVDQGQIDRYIASGSGEEIFMNKFNYHGFRYVKISNINEPPKLSDIKGHLIHTDFDFASTFECSDEDLNRIHDMISYTLRCVGLGGYLVDCPQLERLGYGGDGNASTPTAQIMFNMAPLYYNWLQAWSDVIRNDGGMPHIAPSPRNAGGGPYWCGFIISASWNTYQHYGDVRVLQDYYPVMQKWLGYVDAYSVNGLLKKWPNTEYRNWYLGDWATPEGVGDPNHLDERSVDLVNNCYISVCLQQMENIAVLLGKDEDQKKYSEKRTLLNEKIHNTFFDAEQGYYATGSQIDLIFPMISEVAPAKMREELTSLLIERTENDYDGHLNTGLVGIPVMMEWAATANEPDFIYSMLKKKTYPGYLYMLENGATTTWEHWNGQRSRIHNCYNGVGQWFYQVIGGIRSIAGEPAYRKFVIQPQIPAGVTWAKTTQETPHGTISVHWKLHEESMEVEVEVPVGSIGMFASPKDAKRIKVNNKFRETSEDPIELISGKHFIEFLF